MITALAFPAVEHATAAALLFAFTYAVLGFGALPRLKIDRTGATLIGATGMVAFGVLTPREAAAAIDLRTIALLLGMMIVVAHLRLAGFFGILGRRALAVAHAPRALLALVVVLSGVLSALFVNDTVCLLLTPIVLEVTLALGLAPVPYLLAVAMGSNVGSVATLVGNPQNMLVGTFSGISYARFAAVLTPVAVIGLALTTLTLILFHQRDLAPRVLPDVPPEPALQDRGSLRKALIVTALLMIALLAGVAPSLAALLAASALLITRRIDPREIYAAVDWSLLLMFAGLFIVVEGVEHAGLSQRWLSALGGGTAPSLPALVGLTALMSNLVSNVPAVLLLKSWVAHMVPPERAWLALAMASTLAGNLTLVGSVANLIVVEQARGRAAIGFWAYARVGVPVTLLTLAAGTLWLQLVTRR